MKIISDNEDVENVFRELCEKVQGYGAFIHPDIIIECSAGNLRIRAPESIKEGERLISLSARCLLPYRKFQFYIHQNMLVIKSHEDDLELEQVELMQLMLKIFNLTDKIGQHRKAATLSLYYQDPELLNLLLKTRSHANLHYQRVQGVSLKEFLIDDFFKSRILGVRNDYYQMSPTFSPDPAPGSKTQIFMPVVDCINNHPRSPGFVSAPGPSITVHKSTPNSDGNDECFVRYGFLDAVDALIAYGYPEPHAAFVRSVPITIELGDHKIKVLSTITRSVHKNLQSPLRNLGFFLPRIVPNLQEKTIELSHLYIPQEKAPNALRRVLKHVVSRFNASILEVDAVAMVLKAEKDLIESNHSYYSELLKVLARRDTRQGTEQIVENIRYAAEIQIKKIESYPYFQLTTMG